MGAKMQSEKRHYQEYLKMRQPVKPWFKNAARAFVFGGAVCLVGQGIQETFVHMFHFSEKIAANPTVAILIMLSALVTGLGWYDKVSQWAGAGTAVPVTGFANAIASAALEHRSEGLVLGIGGNMFKLAGPVIVYGVVSAFFVSLVRYLITHG